MKAVPIEDMIRMLLHKEGKILVQATQFFVEKTPWPEGVYQLKPNDVYLLDTPDGTVVVQEGDWIVKTANEENYFVRVSPEIVK